MRFDLLFDDLESQLESQLAMESAQRRGEEERLEAARTSLRERIAAAMRADAGGIRLCLADGSSVELEPATIGRDWLAGETPDGGECVVPLAAVAGVSLKAGRLRASRERPAGHGAGPGELSAKIGVGVVLRDLARRRVPLDLTLKAEALPLHGTVDRVGLDHFDLASHERGVARRESAVLETRIVPLSALVLLRV